MSHVKHCSQSCPEFSGRLKDKDWMAKHPHSIGYCALYRKVVTDCLCGCEEKVDGSIVLWNFETWEETQMHTCETCGRKFKSQEISEWRADHEQFSTHPFQCPDCYEEAYVVRMPGKRPTPKQEVGAWT